MKILGCSKRIGLVMICLALLFSFGQVGQVIGQEEKLLALAQLPVLQGTYVDLPTSLDFDRSNLSTAARSMLVDTGGPDDYGYTWDDSVSYNWIEASGGIPLPIDYVLGPVDLPFPFKFYENTYNKLWVSEFGLVSFVEMTGDAPHIYRSLLPNTNPPNDVIAPYWGVNMGYLSRVYYLTGGTTPSQYFVIQWDNLEELFYESDYTFQMILYENGDIKFQYKTMTYSPYWECSGIGIEDMYGVDGLRYNSGCAEIPAETAILFTRPDPASRVRLENNHYSGFAKPGNINQYAINFKNSGDAGAEVFDLVVDCAWPLTITDDQNGNMLTDTDGSGWPNTGLVAQDAWETVLVNLQAPLLGNIGDHIRCQFGVIPMRNSGKARYAWLDEAIPAPYALVQINPDDQGVSVAVTEPAKRAVYSDAVGNYGYDPAIAEAPNGNLVYAWGEKRYLDDDRTSYTYEINYAIRNRNGGVVKAPTRLAVADLFNLDDAIDTAPAIAVAPDGTIGLAWLHLDNFYKYNHNTHIYFARIDNNGRLMGRETMVYDGYTLPDTLAIAAAKDNTFMLAWEYHDIFIAVYSTAGTLVTPPTNITSGTAGSGSCDSPKVAALGSGHVIIVYTQYQPERDIYFQVRTRTGGIVQAATNLSKDNALNYEASPDVVELSDGNILVAWESGEIDYAVLNAAYSQVGNTQSLGASGSKVSVAADKIGHGIIQAVSTSDGQILYALVNSSAQTVTPPFDLSFIPLGTDLSDFGNSITSHTMPPVTANTDLFLDGPMWKLVTTPAPIGIQVHLGNLGAATASTVTITLIKPDDVSVGSFNPMPDCVGNTCTWTLDSPHLAFLGSGVLSFQAGVPIHSLGTIYQLEMHISSPETDSVLTNNNLTIKLAYAVQSFLPMIRK